MKKLVTTIAAVILLVIVSLGWNLRFIRGYIDLQQSVKAMEKGDLLSASDHMFSVAKHVPEAEDIHVVASFYKGLYFMQEDKCQEALDCFLACSGKIPPDINIDRFIKIARSGAAFNSKDYDSFLTLALEYQKENPQNSMAIGGVASAYACKYVVTGDERFKQQSLSHLKHAEKVAIDKEEYKEYSQRILYRLHNSEILTADQFYEKYPDGWQEPAK